VSTPGAMSANDAWRQLREASDIQFAPVKPKPPPQTPDWLERFGEWLQDVLEPVGRALGMSWPTIQNVLIVLGVMLALVVLWFLLAPLVERWCTRPPTVPEEEWTPDREAAEALLADADVAATNSTKFVLVAVLLALTLFFASIATKFTRPKVQVLLTLVSLAILVVGIVRLLAVRQYF